MKKQVAEEYLLYNFIYMKFNKAKLSDLLLRDRQIDRQIDGETIKKSKGMIHSNFRLAFACAGWEQVGWGEARKGWESQKDKKGFKDPDFYSIS